MSSVLVFVYIREIQTSFAVFWWSYLCSLASINYIESGTHATFTFQSVELAWTLWAPNIN